MAQQPNVQSVSADGYQVSIESYHSTIESETYFSYTVSFQLPDAASIATPPNKIRAMLNFPAEAEYSAITYNAPFGGTGGYTPVNILPSTQNPHSVGIEITLPNPNTNTAMLVSFTATVKVPARLACNGIMLNAFASLLYPFGGDPKIITTAPVQTQLLITNHWIVRKYALNTIHIGNGPIGTCNDATSDNTITYAVNIFLENPYTNQGAQDIILTSMRDIPQGIAGCTFGNITGQINMPNLTNFGGSYGQFATPSGPGAIVLKAENALNNSNHQFSFQMTVPAAPIVPNPVCIDNHIEFTGLDHCGNQVNSFNSIHSYVQRQAAVSQNVEVTKTPYQAGNTTGCPGTYIITVRNRTNAPINGYTYFDFVPECLDDGTGTYGALNSYIDDANTTRSLVNANTGTISCGSNCFSRISGHTFRLFSTTVLQPGDFEKTFVPYTVGNNCDDCFTNYIYTTQNPQLPLNENDAIASANVCVLPNGTIPCVRKAVCDPAHQYKIGETIRFRLSVQNYGTGPMTQFTLKDDLGAIGLSYVNNSESYYVATSRAAAGSVCLGKNPSSFPNPASFPNANVSGWNVNAAPFNQPQPTKNWDGTTLSYTFSTFDMGCDANTLHESNVNSCEGSAGQNIPAFFIEFDALVTANAGIGEIKNVTKLFNGVTPVNLGPSAAATFTVADDINLTLKKEVSTDGGSTWSTGSITSYPGANIQYKLTVKNSGLTLQQPFLLDYLPRNSNTGQQNDRYLINHNPLVDRGSTCDVFYRGAVTSSTPGYIEQFDQNVPQPEEFDAVGDLGITGVAGSFPPFWFLPNIPADAKNVKITYPLLQHGQTISYKLNAQISPDALTGETACNTFAVRGRKKTIFDNVEVPGGVLQLPAESPKVCISLTEKPLCCTPTSYNVPETVCRNVDVQFCVVDDCICLPVDLQNIYTWNFGDGTQPQQGKCVTHHFTNGGTYPVTLSWTNCQTGETITHPDFPVTVQDDCSECSIRPFVVTPIVNGATVHLDATTTTSNQPLLLYIWDFGDNSTGSGPIVDHTYLQSGSYDIHLTVYSIDPDNPGKMCECFKDLFIRVDVELGAPKTPLAKVTLANMKKARQSKSINGISMSDIPNPFNSSLTVSFKGTGLEKAKDTKATLSFIDATGKTVMSQKISSLSATIQLNTKVYPSGVYLLMMQGTDGSTLSNQVIKIK